MTLHSPGAWGSRGMTSFDVASERARTFTSAFTNDLVFVLIARPCCACARLNVFIAADATLQNGGGGKKPKTKKHKRALIFNGEGSLSPGLLRRNPSGPHKTLRVASRRVLRGYSTADTVSNEERGSRAQRLTLTNPLYVIATGDGGPRQTDKKTTT